MMHSLPLPPGAAVFENNGPNHLGFPGCAAAPACLCPRHHCVSKTMALITSDSLGAPLPWHGSLILLL